VTGRTALALAAAAGLGLGGCAAPSGPGPEAGAAAASELPASADWRTDAARAASRAAATLGEAAEATAGAARVAGASAKTAAHGLRRGFERPAASADYGAPPSDAPGAIRSHFRHVMRAPEDASLRIGRPRRGYMNHGLLRGGGVAWRGWLVDVEVTQRASLFGDERRSQAYVVRLRDGEVIDVHRGAEHEFLGLAD